MSTPKPLTEWIEAEKERYKKKLEQLDSSELQKLIAEYEDGSKRLQVLKEKIELIIGSPLQETPAPKDKGKDQSNRPKISAEDARSKVISLLKNHPEGMSKTDIEKQLNIGKPKIEEAIALDKSLFEPRKRGAKAVIRLKA
jgi:hypothetical protein